MKLKKMLALFLALTMSMALAACSPAEEDTQPPSAEPSDAASTEPSGEQNQSAQPEAEGLTLTYPASMADRGYETLEAESVVENYLDSAVMAKLSTVTIIHGKGTGALRKAVHEILKRNKAVKSFRLGRYGEGEAGVTVVELK